MEASTVRTCAVTRAGLLAVKLDFHEEDREALLLRLAAEAVAWQKERELAMPVLWAYALESTQLHGEALGERLDRTRHRLREGPRLEPPINARIVDNPGGRLEAWIDFAG